MKGETNSVTKKRKGDKIKVYARFKPSKCPFKHVKFLGTDYKNILGIVGYITNLS